MKLEEREYYYEVVLNRDRTIFDFKELNPKYIFRVFEKNSKEWYWVQRTYEDISIFYPFQIIICTYDEYLYLKRFIRDTLNPTIGELKVKLKKIERRRKIKSLNNGNS